MVTPDVLLPLLSVGTYSSISGPRKAVVAELSLLGISQLLFANGEYGFELSYGIVEGNKRCRFDRLFLPSVTDT